MIGKRYDEIIDKLVLKGRWSFVDTESGYTELMTWTADSTTILEISHADGIITGVRKYSY